MAERGCTCISIWERCFCVPTGYGKSLIYGCLPRVFDLMRDVHKSIVLLVSPLIALMKDQVKKFRDLGISAGYVGDKSISLESFITGQFQLVLISPESLLRGKLWRNILKSEIYQENLV